MALAIPTFLYRLFDADGTLLYVGITDNVKITMGQHARAQPWWDQIVRMAVEQHPTRPRPRQLSGSRSWPSRHR